MNERQRIEHNYNQGGIMARSVHTVLVALSIVVMQGCYHSRVILNSQPATEYKSKCVNAFLWGLIQENVEPDNCPGSNGLQEVRVNWNLGYSLITIATLGIWSPTQVEWRCAKPCVPPPIDQ
jgi:hypothetical protein